MKVAILGGGNGAHAMTADLSMAGHEVNLYELPKFEENIVVAKMFGRINLVVKSREGEEFTAAAGGKTGVAKITGKITTDMKEAVKDVEVIMLVVPSFAHKAFIENLIPHLEDGHIVVFNPGNFASLEFAKILKEKGVKKDVKIAETECLIYATRLTEPGRCAIMASKEKVLLSALPAKDTKEVLKKVNELYPQFSAAANVFETSINNINFVLHPTPVIMNACAIEEIGPYTYHHYGVTPSVAKVMEAVNDEKMAVAKALGIKQIHTSEILARYYGAKGKNFYEALCDCKAYKVHKSPDSLKYRYVVEDVPYGLVPLASLGEHLGVPTQTIRSIIQIASVMNQTDYWAEGRTVEKLGLAKMSAKDTIKYVTG